jgi:hypothetical protein
MGNSRFQRAILSVMPPTGARAELYIARQGRGSPEAVEAGADSDAGSGSTTERWRVLLLRSNDDDLSATKERSGATLPRARDTIGRCSSQLFREPIVPPLAMLAIIEPKTTPWKGLMAHQ